MKYLGLGVFVVVLFVGLAVPFFAPPTTMIHLAPQRIQPVDLAGSQEPRLTPPRVTLIPVVPMPPVKKQAKKTTPTH